MTSRARTRCDRVRQSAMAGHSGRRPCRALGLMPVAHHRSPEPGPGPQSDPADEPSALSFPDGPRTRLDELLGELTGQAQAVLIAQGKLRGLLRASNTVAAELNLPKVLHSIVDAARLLAGARYAALGVVGPDGLLEQFLHAGIDGPTAAQIGSLPQGKGLLGALIDHPTPIRLTRIADDPRSVGFPPHHPPMDSFLGVPIRVRGEVFGNLYLTERTDGDPFSPEDVELVTALASSAGVAISHARLYGESERRQRWLSDTADVIRALLGGERDEPLELVAECAARHSDAVFAAVLLPGDDKRLVIKAVAGERADSPLGRMCDADSLADRASRTVGPVLASGDDELLGQDPAWLGVGGAGRAIAVALRAGDVLAGVLAVARAGDAHPFTAADVEMIDGYAGHVALALELGRRRADRQAQGLLDDHDRIADDLRQHVIRQLFTVAMSLHTVAASLPSGMVADRLRDQVTTVDDVIARIRQTVYQLAPTVSRAGPAQAGLLEVARDAAKAMGFEPGLQLSGLVDALPADVSDNVIEMAREALAIGTWHSGATAVDLAVALADDVLVVEVIDNGCGLGVLARASGVADLKLRAEAHGGTLGIEDVEPSGARLTWTIPVNRRR